MTESQSLNYLKKNEFDVQSARACLLVCDLYFRVYADAKLFKHNLDLQFGYVKTFDDKASFYQITPIKTMQDFSRDVYHEYLEAPRKLIKKIETRDKIHRGIELIWKQYDRKQRKTPKDSAVFFKKLLVLMKQWISYASIGEDKWQIIETEFVPGFAVKNNISESEAKNLLAVLSHPEEIGIFNLERKMFLNICLHILRDKKLKDAILRKDFNKVSEHVKLKKLFAKYRGRFFWIKTDFCNVTEITPLVFMGDTRKEIINKSVGDLKKELRKIDANINALRREKKKIISKLKIDNADKRILGLLKLAVVWHDKRKEDMTKQFYYFF